MSFLVSNVKIGQEAIFSLTYSCELNCKPGAILQFQVETTAFNHQKVN